MQGKPDSLVVAGIAIDFDSNGRIDTTAAGSTGCIELWNEVLDNAEPVVPYVANAAPDAWSALGAGTLCLFIHQYGKAFSVSNQQPATVHFVPAQRQLDSATQLQHVINSGCAAAPEPLRLVNAV